MHPFIESNIAAYPTLLTVAIRIFAGFVQRENGIFKKIGKDIVMIGTEEGKLDYRMARNEAYDFISKAKDWEDYATKIRKGAPFTMTRRERKALWLTWENALNHASFEVGME